MTPQKNNSQHKTALKKNFTFCGLYI